MPTRPQSSAAAGTRATVRRVGCVSYLNAKPLIEGLDAEPGTVVRYDVPARLLDDLEAGEVNVALCPVIDYHRSRVPLVIVPAGGIGCDGPTLTVRLFSRTPIDQLDAIHADTDSHTSVALLQVLLEQLHGRRPRLIDYHAREHVAGHRLADAPEAMLLIGDKVVTDAPPADVYPHQLDLGESWKAITGLPFVFAVWMARRGTDLGDLPARLAATRETNARRIDELVERHAARHGWPADLARQYLGHILRYAIGPRELQAIERFSALAADRGLIDAARPLELAR